MGGGGVKSAGFGGDGCGEGLGLGVKMTLGTGGRGAEDAGGAGCAGSEAFRTGILETLRGATGMVGT